MKIAFDIDGTLMEWADYYKEMINAFRQSGHTVGIITGRPIELAKEDQRIISDFGIKYDFYYIIDQSNPFNHLEGSMLVNENEYIHRDDIVCIWKARMCVEQEINILFDDAADLILRHLPLCWPTLILKSPTTENRLLPKWEKNKYLKY